MDDDFEEPTEPPDEDAEEAELFDVGVAEFPNSDVSVTVAFAEWFRNGDTRADAGSVAVASGDGVNRPAPPPETCWLLIDEESLVVDAETS